jgi:plastocyanin
MFSMRLVCLATALALSIACSSSSSPSSPSTPSPSSPPATGGPSSPVAIPSGAESLGNRAYAPDDLTVTAGTTVTWTNNDSIAHTSTSDGSGWNSGLVAPGGQFSQTFQTPGTFSYHCTIHPGMVGTVVVR